MNKPSVEDIRAAMDQDYKPTEQMVRALLSEHDRLTSKLQLLTDMIESDVTECEGMCPVVDRLTQELAEAETRVRQECANLGFEAIASYRCEYLRDEDGDGIELSDIIANALGDSDISRAKQELRLLSDHVYNSILTGQQGQKVCEWACTPTEYITGCDHHRPSSLGFPLQECPYCGHPISVKEVG